MDVVIAPSELEGAARAPPSKSYTHRAILAAGLSAGGTVRQPLVSADTEATMRAVEAFGGAVERGTDIEVEGVAGEPGVPGDVIDCANSGTTMRLATAVAGLVDGATVLTGDASLRDRPQGPLLAAIEDLDGRAESTRDDGRAPLVVRGPIEGGAVRIPGDVSSQFVTALLFAGACTDEGIAVELATPLKSAPYVDVTIDLLADFGVRAVETESGYRVDGGQRYVPPADGYEVPGDFSSISYLLAAGALAARDGLTVEGAHPSAQGDAAIVDVLERMGATIEWDRSAGRIEVERSALSGATVDVEDTPDLLPTVAVLGAAADGRTRIENCEHVRYKETDRVAAMAEGLRAMGASVEESREELVVHGGETTLEGTRLDGRGDHRLVMAFAVAGLVADGETTVAGAEDVDVSFPEFFDVLEGCGANLRRPGE